MNLNAAYILSVTLVIFVVEIKCKKGKHQGKGWARTHGKGGKKGKSKDRRTVNPQDIHADYQKMLRDFRLQVRQLTHQLETYESDLGHCENEFDELRDIYENNGGDRFDDNSTSSVCDEKCGLDELKRKYQQSYVSQSRIVDKKEAEIKSLKKQLLKGQRSGLDTIIKDLESENQDLDSEIENLESEKTLKDRTIETLKNKLELASQNNECSSTYSAPRQILKTTPSPQWKHMKTPKNGIVTLTWKVNDAGKRFVDVKKVNEWVSSIMCMLMSLTKVNLVEATSLKRADIPISFLDQAEYKALNKNANSIAFCDSDQMNQPKPTAPVYVNIQSKCARWRSIDQDVYLSQPDSSELVHMKYYSAFGRASPQFCIYIFLVINF